MSIEVKYYNRFSEGHCLGIVNIYLREWDLYLNGIRHLQSKNGGTFFGWPSKSYEKDGETKYAPYYLFGKEMNKKFQASLALAVEKYLAEAPQAVEQPAQEEMPF